MGEDKMKAPWQQVKYNPDTSKEVSSEGLGN
jgi:hypothetical protein